jgi:hypothetical protein
MEGEPAQAPAPAPTETNAGGNYQQGYQQAGMPTAAQAPAPAPTETTAGGTYQQGYQQAGMPTAAQAPAPVPTETTAGGTYQQGNEEAVVVEERPGIRQCNTGDESYRMRMAPKSSSDTGPTVDYYASTTGRRRKKREL